MMKDDDLDNLNQYRRDSSLSRIFRDSLGFTSRISLECQNLNVSETVTFFKPAGLSHPWFEGLNYELDSKNLGVSDALLNGSFALGQKVGLEYFLLIGDNLKEWESYVRKDPLVAYISENELGSLNELWKQIFNGMDELIEKTLVEQVSVFEGFQIASQPLLNVLNLCEATSKNILEPFCQGQGMDFRLQDCEIGKITFQLKVDPRLLSFWERIFESVWNKALKESFKESLKDKQQHNILNCPWRWVGKDL